MLKKTVVVLYVLLAAVLAGATFLEHAFGTSFTNGHIYHTYWFCCLWGALSVAAVMALVRFRLWRRFPVLLLHGSLLIILGGAFLTFLTGEKGYVHLTEGKEVSSFTQASGGGEAGLPFSIRLDSFRIRYYPGTEAPSDYLSYVTCKSGRLSHSGVISMNRILSVEGYRFYQSSFDEDFSGSWLSVNHDPWGIPLTYTGYVLLALSAVWLLFSRKETFFRLLRHPLLGKGMVLLLLLGLQVPLQARPVSVLARQDAEKLKARQVIYHDRVVPFNTLARDFVLKLTGKVSYNGLTPEQVVAGWMLYPDEWQHEPMFRVKSESLRRELGLDTPYAALTDLFEGKTYRLEQILRECRKKKQAARPAEERRLGKFEKDILELDEKVGMVLMLNRGTFIRPLPDDGSVTPLPEPKIRAELFYNAVPFTRILFMANLSFGVLGFLLCLYVYLRKNGRWEGRPCVWGRRGLAVAAYLSCAFHWTGYLLRAYIGGRIPLGNGYETMLFMAGCLLLCTCVWQRRFSFLLPSGFLLSGLVLLVAFLGEMNPQISPLMPVLLSPWLSIHVSLIMISYALFALMFLCGILAFLVRRRPLLVERLMLFCRLTLYPSVFFLAVGIFAGAVWANVSWGSYWSWDPKEVWALITLMVYGVAFHTRSLSVFRKPLFFHLYMVLAFTTVLMTYFGVNYVLGGMHSYAG